VSGTLAFALLDGLFISLSRNIVTHLKVLNKRLRTSTLDDFKDKKYLIKLIDYHNEINDCCTKLNKLYFPILITQFVFAALAICLVIFQFFWVCLKAPVSSIYFSLTFYFLQAHNFVEKISALGFISGNCISIYFYNMYGTEIIEQVSALIVEDSNRELNFFLILRFYIFYDHLSYSNHFIRKIEHFLQNHGFLKY
jgi:uncharacterized membrane protein YozB (DUF420 family)